QWVDKDGRKVFSDRPPPVDVPAKNILKQPGGSLQPAPRPQAAPADAVAGTQPGAAVAARPGAPASAASAPQLSGTIPVRAVVPIGRPGTAKPPIRVEADLARAGIDGLVPGLTKPTGKPGRLSFTLVDAGQTYELRDFALDAAPASARGSLTISPEGGLERADFTNVKLSPGDDLRVSLDRTGNGYK
ncbi:DUF4124 domain-containing protein, partial [Shigella flexneri]|uniref:DUF4124 domain-containing protein n=1 Tax=Shigella flexneri TaxID=623 RepID=UPI001C0A9080